MARSRCAHDRIFVSKKHLADTSPSMVVPIENRWFHYDFSLQDRIVNRILHAVVHESRGFHERLLLYTVAPRHALPEAELGQTHAAN